MITDTNPSVEQVDAPEFSAPELSSSETAEQATARESQASIKADQNENTTPVEELIIGGETVGFDTGTSIAQQTLDAMVSTPSDEASEFGKEPSDEELDNTDAPTPQTGGGGGEMPPPDSGDEY